MSMSGKAHSPPYLFVAGLLCLSGGDSLRADDTEVYQAVYTVDKPAGRPKVLIVLDDSSSMDTYLETRMGYDPDAQYTGPFDESRIYWVDQNGNEGSFPAAANFCAESLSPLASTGYFESRARYWTETQAFRTGDLVADAGWVAFNQGDAEYTIVDCEADVLNSNPGNRAPEPDGYPFLPPAQQLDGQQVRDRRLKYAAVERDESNVSWGTVSYRLRTGHYMNWESDPDATAEFRTRLEVAQQVVTDLISANTGLDFGLALFNYNDSGASDGGRIAKKILAGVDDPPTAEDRETHRSELLAAVNSTTAQGFSPLCETTYEAYRYLAGDTVLFGDNWLAGVDTPPPDPEAQDASGRYLSPAAVCNYTYLILLTDSEPLLDESANAAIEQLTQSTCNVYGDEKNCLPELAEYMSTTDLDNDPSNGNQHAITYTIGFGTDQELLADTALMGRGEYFTADDSEGLIAAFQNAILGIQATEASFTSPAVAVDSFSRTQSRNEVFFAMFTPAETVDWRGNIKKLQFDIRDGVAIIVDRDRDPALNPFNGEILPNASTFWSDSDGGRVEEGGVGALLASRDPGSRVIRTNTGVGGALEDFSSDNLDAQAYGFDQSAADDPDGALFDLFGVSDQAELDALLNWSRGYEISEEDGSIVGTREWILGDMLHSRPLIVNYGGLGVFDPNEPDQRIVVGTNSGFLHMFGNDDGEEDWAFFPKELAPVLARRAANATSPDNVYAVDASPVLYRSDLNLDGTINAAEGDKAYLYFGLRRGGRMLYALDITDPDNPAFLWFIDPQTDGFAELGQTWSDPVVTHIPGYVDGDGRRKPVLVFAAGYDASQDAPGLVTPDSMGRGIYIVDAQTGALVWSVTPAANSATNLQAPDLLYSVPAVVTPLDSNGDELADRLYFGDTGGNLWRVDMPGRSLPTALQDTWSIVKIAAMNGGAEGSDRRFFGGVDVVRTRFSDRDFDALLIGTGDRSNPNGTDVANQFYMIRDPQIRPYNAPAPSAEECAAPDPVFDFRCQLPLGPDDLFDVTNPIQEGTPEEQSAALAELLAANGWRLDLSASGEKSLSRAITIAGSTFFTTFAPEVDESGLCDPYPGVARLYALGLATAGAEFDFDGNTSVDRFWTIGSLIPDSPSPHFGRDGEIRLLLPPGGGGGELPSNPLETGASMPKPYGSYWYREEL